MLNPDIAARAEQITEDFHRLYYDGFETTWEETYWHGVKILKCPLDLWVYQEIIWDQRPDLIVETGTAHGGSALWFAHMLDLIGHGHVVTIDVCGTKFFPDRVPHQRITYIEGSSTDPKVIDKVTAMKDTCGWINTLVVLDSDHSAGHVLNELQAWSPLVPVGGYVIVEDGNVHGHPVVPEHGPGPTEGVAKWMTYNPGFEIDRSKEKFRLTFNPGGYLRRVR
jgi:cephalosporin hydroxylase